MLRVLLSCLALGLALASSPLLERVELSSNLELFTTNLDEPAYRLLDTVQPSAYFVDLDVYVDEAYFTGVVTIDVDVTVTGLFQIVLHQKVVAITGITVTNSAGDPVQLRSPDWVEYDSYFELMKINFEGELPVGAYTLRIAYDGQINVNQFDRGFYRGWYFLNGEQRYYATTQFQPYHARKAFPCFDEPQFKSRFTIAITRPTAFSKSYSNMAIDDNLTEVFTNGRTREVFLPTPVVSAYLVAFHVSDFVESYPGSTAARPVGIVSRPGPVDQHEFAGNMAADLTTWLDSFTGIDYYQHGQGVPMKNDHIALPDFPSGAMENWGMVNYREAYLLYDENNTNLIYKTFIATIVAHELAHKWFGNLVTCFWWSNLWLNESFASFFEYFAPHGVDPSFELADQFIVDYVHSALLADSGAGAWAMNHPPVATNAQISAHFSTSSYAKGASVLRMLEHLVGPATFQKALQYYLRDNAYGLGTPELMYAGFTTAVAEDNSLAQYENNPSIAAIFQSFVDQPGAPLLHVDVNMETGLISLRQSRFLISGAEGEGLWHIPLTYTRGDNPDFSDTKPMAVMTTQTAALQVDPGHAWVIFNNQQSGYYRVMYDDHSWEMIASALRNNRESIHKLNRAQIVNDVLNFVRAGTLSVDRAFDVLEFLHEETDYYVWAAALTPLDWQRRRILHIDDLKEQFETYMLEEMEAAIQAVGYDELATDTTSIIMNRGQLLNMACNLGHEGCIADSQAKWDAWRANPNQLVPVNLRRHVYCTGLRYGDASDYQFLWQQYSQSENTADMVTMLRAMGCTRDPAVLTTYLLASTNSDLIRYHDRTNAFVYALQGNNENVQTVLNFIYNNYQIIREGYGGSDRLAVAFSNLAAYLYNYEDILEFQTWLYQNQLNLPGEFSTGVSVINTATNNIRWGNDKSLEYRGFLRQRNAANGVFASITLLFSVVIFQIFK